MASSVLLSLCGDVERPACLALAELRSLMDAELVTDFHCHEGWSRLGERWREFGSGPCWRSLRQLTRPAMSRSAPASTPPCSPASKLGMSGCSWRSSTKEPRALGAGFPRLVGPSEWDCFLSVKSVDRIEVTREPQQATAATIALARLER
jgi:DMSO/TMAO reductase YedYZ molybdopterin-dependent catalytic subunit